MAAKSSDSKGKASKTAKADQRDAAVSKDAGIMGLLTHEVNDLASVERQLIQALPKLAEMATNSELKQAILSHLGETRAQQMRLEEARSTLGIKEEKVHKCEAMAAILAEGKRAAKRASPAEVTDAAIISGSQRIEHYEMAGYGTAVALARLLGQIAVAELLEQSLEEEKNADQTLSRIAEQNVNPDAAAASPNHGAGAGRSSTTGAQSTSTLRSASAGSTGGSASTGAIAATRSISMPRDYDDRDVDRYQSRSGGYSNGGRSRREDDDNGRGGSYEGRSRGGRHSAQVQERDEYGQFAGSRSGNGWTTSS